MTHSQPEAIPPKPRRRWLRFSLRGLMVFMFVFGLMLAWPGQTVFQSRYEKGTARQIEQEGGHVWWQGLPSSNPFGDAASASQRTTYQSGMMRIFGEDVFDRIGDALIPRSDVPNVLTRLSKSECLHELRLGPGTIDEDAIAKIQSLETLEFNDTTLTAAQLRRLTELPNLRSLHLVGRPVTQDNLQEMARFPALEEVSISANETTHILWVLAGGRWSGSSSPQDGTLLAALKDAKQIKQLEIVDFTINDACMQAISQMESLQSLRIGSSGFAAEDIPISAEGIAALESLPKLMSLKLSASPLDDAMAESVSRLKGLRLFEGGGAHISDVGLMHLNRLSKLECLSISNCQANLNAIGTLKSDHPNCQVTITISTPGINFFHEPIVDEQPGEESPSQEKMPGGLF